MRLADFAKGLTINWSSSKGASCPNFKLRYLKYKVVQAVDTHLPGCQHIASIKYPTLLNDSALGKDNKKLLMG
jgi:hypothetical protein